MKNLTTLFTAIFILSISAFNFSTAQNVTVSGALVGNNTYATLSAAFTAINGGGQTGANISILINGNTTEPPTGAVLNEGAWSTVSIQPNGGTAKTISAAANPGTPLIDFHGADRVKIDGLNSGGNSLTISNTTVSGAGGTSTIRFAAGAAFNVVTRCTVLGSSNSNIDLPFSPATILFGDFFSAFFGLSDNNTISFCDIGPAGTNLPSFGVVCGGNNNFLQFNRGDTVRNCNIYDYFSSTGNSGGIACDLSRDMSIINNKFYQTAPRTIMAPSTVYSVEHSAIKISGGFPSAKNYNITENTIGFSSSAGTGTYSINVIPPTGRTVIFGINLFRIDTAANAASVQGNTIAGITISEQIMTVPYIQFIGILIDGGSANVGDIAGNIIGSHDGQGSITLNSNSFSEAQGISNSALHLVCNNNLIGGITAAATNGNSLISGIYNSFGTSSTFICRNNIIGGNSANSIINMAAGGAIYGISNVIFSGQVSSKSIEITGNIIRNLNSSFVPITGISIRSQAANNTISQNTVHTLNNAQAGIYFTGPPGIGNNTVSQNTVYDLIGAQADLLGIYFGGSTGNNNMVSQNAVYSLINAKAGIYFISAMGGNNTVSKNTVHSLINPQANVSGIYFSGADGTSLISGNFVHALLSNDEYATITGIQSVTGNVTYQNNMVQLGLDTSGNSLNTSATIYGIIHLGSESNLYFNSIYIGGNQTGGSSNTFAFISTVNSTRNYRNNIFYNSRSNLASFGKNYAVQIAGTVPNPAGLTINNNVYLADGVGGVFGKYNSIDIPSLSAWQSAVGQDANSYEYNPHFIEPDGSSASVDLHIKFEFPTIINGNGFNITSVTEDYDGNLRSALTPVDIGADAGDFPSLYPNDIQLLSAVIENQVVILGNSYDIKASPINVGTNSQNSFPMYYTVNGGSPVGPVNTVGPFPQLGSEEVTFSGINSYTPSSLGINTLKIYSALASDNNRANDTITLLINVQQKVTSLPFVETFSNMSNWSVLLENPLYDTKLWELGLCMNPAGNDSDIAATSNCYLGAEGRREILKSPVLDFSSFTFGSSTNFPVLDFYVSYTGYLGLDDSLEVLLSTNNGSSFFSASTVFNKSQTSTPSLATRPVMFTEFFPDSLKQWRHEQISLANVAGDSNVIIGFRSKSDFGNRQWIDNIIVSEATGFTSQTVSSPGIYNFGNISIDMNTVGLRPSLPNFILANSHSGIFKLAANKKNIIGGFPGETGHVKFDSNNENDNPSGGVLTVAAYPYQNPVPSLTSPEFEQNNSTTGVSTGDGSRFTPNTALPDVYITASYSGNDYTGYANYDIRINVSAITSIEDINKAYILKRADRTGTWVCQNTTVSGDTLIASGLDNFSDFSVGVYSVSKTLNLSMLIQGFYNVASNSMVQDTLRVYLRNSSSPYSIIDSAKTYLSSSGAGAITFSNAMNGVPYYIQLKHRNSIETWSALGQSFVSGFLTYSFAAAASQAFGNNMIEVDNSPPGFAIYSGDVNQDGVVDLSDLSLIDNDAYNFVSGYVSTDLTGDDFVDLNDLSIADNNAFNFVGKSTP